MSYGTPGIPSNPPFPVTGTPNDGDVPTSDGAGGVSWQPGGGGGGGGITYDGTVTDGQVPVYDDTANEYIPTLAGAPVYSVKNPISYTRPMGGAARMVRAAGASLSTTGTIDTGASTTTLTVASATSFERGHGIAIQGAGADHGLSAPAAPVVLAVTQTAPVVNPTATTYEAPVTWTMVFGTNVATTSVAMTIANGTPVIVSNQGGALPTVAATPIGDMSTTYYWRAATTTTGTFHPTALDATNNTNVLDFDGNGTGTHTIHVVGSTSYGRRTKHLSGNGGYSAQGTEATATGNATLDSVTKLFIAVPKVAGAEGGVLYDSTGGYALCRYNGTAQIRAIVADAAGFTSLKLGDIGRTLVQGSHDGIVRAFDNATRTIFVEPIAAADTFPGGAAVAWTITSGTGAGTQTAASTEYIEIFDCGATTTAIPYKHFGRRNSAECYVGEIIGYPVSSSMLFYEVVEVFGDRLLASSAPTYDTDLGDLTRDGKVVLRRIVPPFTPTPPASAVRDVHWTTITNVSGTTVTFADAASASVTSLPVWHDDTDAIQAWWAQCAASGAASGTLYFPGAASDYWMVLGHLAGGSKDARYTGAASSDTARLFNFYTSGSPTPLDRTWLFDKGARISFRHLDVLGSVPNDTDFSAVWELARSKPTMINGTVVFAPFGEPVLEKGERGSSSGYNRNYFFNTNSSETNINIDGPTFIDCAFHGWPWICNNSGTRGYGQGERWIRCYISYGGADADGCWYTKGGVFEDCTVIGIRYSRSLILYQDSGSNAITQPIRMLRGYYKGARKNGFRFRANDYQVDGTQFVNCGELIDDNNPVSGMIARCVMDYTTINMTGTKNLILDSLTLTDSPIFIDTGNARVTISKVHSTTPAGGTQLTATVTLLAIGGGTDIKVSDSFFVGLSPANSPDVRAISLSGGSGRVDMTNVTAYGNDNWGLRVSSGYSGAFNTTQCSLGSAASEVVEFGGAAGATWKSVNDTFQTSNGSHEINLATGGRVELINPTMTGAMTINSGMTGPILIQGGASTGSTTAVITEPSTRIEGHDFAVAPTLTGATLFLQGCMVAGNKVASPSALASGVTNDYALGVQNIHRITPNGSDSTLGGIVARAAGCPQKLINVHATANLILDDDGGGSTATNRFAFAALTIPAGGSVVLDYDATATLWRMESKNF